MRKNVIHLFLVLSLSMMLIVVALALLGLPAAAANQCAAPGGAGGCKATVQAAIDAAGSGDTVWVVTGIYTENLVITKNVTLKGGCSDGTCSTQTPRTSIINGNSAGVVISVTHGADPTIDGFTIINGDGSGNMYQIGANIDSGGGGIFIWEATALIWNNLIEDNVGSHLSNTIGLGGGILVISSTTPVRIYSNTIRANVAQSVTLASSVPISTGVGGGIVVGNASSAIITSNQVISNVALRANIPPDNVWSAGGGIAWWGTDLTVDNNDIWYNTGNEAGGSGAGGGITAWGGVATVTNNSIMQNTAVISGREAEGGGLTFGGSTQKVTLTGNWVMSNTAIVTAAATGSDTRANGGGIVVAGWGTTNEDVTVEDNHIIGNVGARTMTASGDGAEGSAEGGGLSINAINTTQVISNEVRGNTLVENLSLSGTGSDWAGRPSGGGIYLSQGDTVTLNDNKVIDNIAVMHHEIDEAEATSEGGGVVLENVTNATVNNNVVSGNTAVVTAGFTSSSGKNYHPGAGGISANCYGKSACMLSLTGNDILNNTTAFTITVGGTDAESGASGGGLGIDEVHTIVLNGNWVMSNTAVVSITSDISDRNTNVAGGGIHVNGYNTLNDSLNMQDNHVIYNLAAHTIMVSGTNAMAHAEGGGLFVSNITTTQIISNEVRENTAVEDYSVRGDGSQQWGGRPCGGGMYLGDNGTVTLNDNTVRDNVAATQQVVEDANSAAEGGGICLNNPSNATLSNNIVSHNSAVIVASLTSDANEDYRAGGGGILVNCHDRPDCVLSLTGNDVLYNTAAYTITVGGGSSARGNAHGGGVYVDTVSNASFYGDIIEDNQALVFGSASGSNEIEFRGGGLLVESGSSANNPSLAMTGSRIESNIGFSSGSGSTRGRGGGIQVSGVADVTLTGNTIISNVTAISITASGHFDAQGGGIDIGSNDAYTPTVVISNNTIAYNTSVITATAAGSNQVSVGGGGANMNRVAAATLISNHIHSNVGIQNGIADGSSSRVGVDGGGLNLNEMPSVTLQRNRVEDNVAAASITRLNGADGGGGGGGISFNRSTVLLEANVISHNTANLSGEGWGGGVNCGESKATMNGNLIAGNRMNTAYSGGTGGVWVWESTLTSTNNIFAHNYDGVGGGGNGTPSAITLVNDTLFDNGRTGGSANDSSTMWVTNTIVFSHVEGLREDGSGTLTGNYNLLTNDNNYVNGATGGSNDILNQNPSFVNAGADDFHLASDSPAIDKGSNAVCPATDYDGNIRPADGDEDGTDTCDIGAYEKMSPKLRLTKSVEGAPVPGGRIIYTVVITNSGALTATKAVVYDTLASSLIFAGPIELEPTGTGTPGTAPPVLASSLTMAPGARITVTFPVTVTTAGVVSGTVIANTAVVTCSQLAVPVSGTVTITVSVPTRKTYLPLVLKN